MKKVFLLILAFCWFQHGSAYGSYRTVSYSTKPFNTMISDRLVFHLDVFSPGIFAEVNIFSEATVFAGYQYGALLSYPSKEDSKRVNEIHFLPQLMVNFRHYYNVRQRIIENKETAKFSSDYIGLHISRVFETEINEPFMFAGPVWGLQRSLIDFIHLNFSVGAGYYFSSELTNYNHFNVIADVHVGFSF